MTISVVSSIYFAPEPDWVALLISASRCVEFLEREVYDESRTRCRRCPVLYLAAFGAATAAVLVRETHATHRRTYRAREDAPTGMV